MGNESLEYSTVWNRQCCYLYHNNNHAQRHGLFLIQVQVQVLFGFVVCFHMDMDLWHICNFLVAFDCDSFLICIFEMALYIGGCNTD